MPRYRIRICYDGTDFAGWQIQPNGRAIQEVLEEALKTFLRSPIRIIGAGRTDAGVHALSQFAHFDHGHPLDPYKFLRSINGLIPPTIRVLQIEKVADDFHARYSVEKKVYHYHLWLDPVQSPFQRLYTTHHPYPFDLEAVLAAITHFKGTHDFTSFANVPLERDPVRSIDRLDIVDQEGGIRFEVEGKSFLYKMVRNIVGTLLEVAEGKREPASIPDILAAKDRREAGRAAPAQGLFLHSITYPSNSLASNEYSKIE